VRGGVPERGHDTVLAARDAAKRRPVRHGARPTEHSRYARIPRFEARSDGPRGARRAVVPASFFFREGAMKDQLLKKLQDEIATLDRELKTDLPREIRRARELGDLRENAEYHAAKERQTFVQARLAMLQKRFATVSMIDLDRLPHGKAALGSTVHLRDGNGTEVVYQLVMPEDADPDKGQISASSPIGRALLGKEEGDEVVVQTPMGRKQFELRRLVTIHDSQ